MPYSHSFCKEKPDGIPKSFIEVLDRGSCCWIEGDVKADTATFCGESPISRSPYCEAHHKRAWMGKRVRDREYTYNEFALPEWRPEKATAARMKRRARA